MPPSDGNKSLAAKKIVFLLMIESIIAMMSFIIDSIDYLAMLSFIETVTVIACICFLGYGFFSIPALFTLLTFVFHCSQFFIHAMHIDYI